MCFKLLYHVSLNKTSSSHHIFLNFFIYMARGTFFSLAGSLLDSVNGQIEELVHKSSIGKEKTLLVDRWSNIHSEPITVSCVHINGKLHIAGVEDTGANKKTEKLLSKRCRDIIDSWKKVWLPNKKHN